MTRRALVFAACAAAGCGSGRSEFRFPETASAWTRTQSPIAATPAPGAREAWQATYAGPFPVTLTINEMNSAAGALDAIQRWRSEPGKAPFYRDRYFGVAESAGATTKDLTAFVQAFEEAGRK